MDSCRWVIVEKKDENKKNKLKFELSKGETRDFIRDIFV